MDIQKRIVPLNSHGGEIVLGVDPRHVTELLQMFHMEECEPAANAKTKDGRQRGGQDHVHTAVGP